MPNGELSGGGIAFGAPGMPPRWTSSSKDGVGTAYSTPSRVWFTVSHGILNEIYYPTIDRPQTRDLQFLITDGETFFHEEKRDLKWEIHHIERHTLGYRVLSEDPQGRYRLTKEIISDPHQPCVLIDVRLEPAEEWKGKLQVYVLLSPHLEVGGWGNSAQRFHAAGREILVAWKNSTFLAMGTEPGFTKSSCGYVGASDGWQDLSDNYTLNWQFDRADSGNIAVTGQIPLDRDNHFTLGVAFGESQHMAASILTQSLSVPFAEHRDKFIEQWHRPCKDIHNLDDFSGDGGRLFRISHSLLLAHEDKTYAGALIASASIPWGEAKGDEDLGGYHLVWTRDMVNSATGLLACGDTTTARRALVYLACTQRPDGGFPQNFWIDGKPYWNGIQLDEVAFPVMLAWRLWKAEALGDFDPYPMIKAAAGFLARMGPATQQERWEEDSGYSPSTLAACIAGLVCAADFSRDRGEADTATFIEEYADFLESHLEAWTVTTQGTLVSGIPRHYIRICPTDINNPVPAEDPNQGAVVINNRPPGEPWLFPAKDIVDAGFLELVRYGIRQPGHPIVEDSLRVVDAVLKVETRFGPVWRRYNYDGYGQRADGGPFEGFGQGRAWPLLTGERGHYEMAAGRDPGPYICALEAFASRGGLLPEQVWDDPGKPQLLGRPTGSAMPLMWAHSEYIKLLRSWADGRVFDLIPVVASRYLAGKGRKDLEIWKPVRQIHSVPAGRVLRVQMPEPFLLHWSSNEWRTSQDLEAQSSGLGLYFVDLLVEKSQHAPMRFTFYWTKRQAWEGRDYSVEVV
ncbi:MAG TPA: glycoside hydrolase family 15 protein [Terriglobia bacterium]|nr:glycoside hydrolase family 15 protein [Terriglobia bacterium]